MSSKHQQKMSLSARNIQNYRKKRRKNTFTFLQSYITNKSHLITGNSLFHKTTRQGTSGDEVTVYKCQHSKYDTRGEHRHVCLPMDSSTTVNQEKL